MATSNYPLPSEIFEGILLHLPITASLASTGFASKVLLAQPLFNSFTFASKHIRHQHKLSNLSFWSFLNCSGLIRSWTLLPLSYQAAIYKEVLTGDAWPKHENNIEFDSNFYTLYTRNWTQPSSVTLRLTESLLQLPTNLFNPACNENRALRWAISGNHSDIVALLVQDSRVDPSVFYNNPIRSASKGGMLDIVRSLLSHSRVDPAALNNWAIQKASECGHASVVSLLLSDSRVDPTVHSNYCIRIASEKGHLETVRVLLEDCRVIPFDVDVSLAKDQVNCGDSGDVPPFSTQFTTRMHF